jgi:DNA uptake protein ComE-like DNA-binding protein
MSWKSFINDYFSFSRSERFGTLALCGAVMLALTATLLLPRLLKHPPPDTSAYEEEILRFRRAVDTLAAQNRTNEPMFALFEQPLFRFDPNRASDAEWKRLGLNERQIRNIRNYQAKGGRFRQKADLQKLYTISAPQYQRLEPYILIDAGGYAAQHAAPKTEPDLDEEGSTEKQGTIAATPFRIELNTADSSLLTQLYGIGPTLAARTVKYRSRIGGFAAVEQLSEVYGVSPELVKRLSPQLSVDVSLVRKISVNTATFNVLIDHPYLSKQQARGILYYRKQQNRIDGIDELVRNNILKREDAEKIRPYLTFE